MKTNAFALVCVALLILAASACGGGDNTKTSGSAIGTRKGVDYSWARPAPDGLAAEGYTFAARYLSSGWSGKNLGADEAQSLRSAGVDVVVVWETSGTATLGGYSQGVSDATEADAQANADGIPGGRPIYFAIDFDAQPSDQGVIDGYFDGVAAVIGRDRTGAYAGYYAIQQREITPVELMAQGGASNVGLAGEMHGTGIAMQMRDALLPGAVGADGL